MSDHKLITFYITSERQEPVEARNYEKTNWHLFKIILNAKKKDLSPTGWSTDILEKEANKIIEEINFALDKACPLRVVSKKQKRNKWWTEELQSHKTKVINTQPGRNSPQNQIQPIQ